VKEDLKNKPKKKGFSMFGGSKDKESDTPAKN